MTGMEVTRPWLRERILFGVIALPSSWLTIRFIFNLLHYPGGFFVYGVPALTSGTLALLCWWFVLRGHHDKSREVMRLGCLSGFAVGGIGLVLGFLGPMLLAPTGEQGPLLGIFVTGPLGFVVGMLAGAIVARIRVPRCGVSPRCSVKGVVHPSFFGEADWDLTDQYSKGDPDGHP